MVSPPLRTNFYDEYPPKPNNVSAAEYNLNAQRTDQALDLGLSAASRLTVLESAGVTLTGAQSLSSKTLVSPRIQYGLKDADGRLALDIWNNGSSPVNYPVIQNSDTGQIVRLLVWGADDNVDLQIAGKGGSGRVLVERLNATSAKLTNPLINRWADPNGNILIDGIATGGAANYITVTNAENGYPPVLMVNGPGSDITLLIAPKNNGRVGITRLYSDGALLEWPSINQVRNNAGTAVLDFWGTADGVNRVALSNNIAGQSPYLFGVGQDPDIGIRLIGKGSSIVAAENGNGIAAQFYASPGAVAWLRLIAEGATPVIQPHSGADSVDMVIRGKNAGYVGFGSVTRHKVLTSATRPEASAAGKGAWYYDDDYDKPVYSDGATWRDAMGTAA